MEPQTDPQSKEPMPHEIRFIINCPQCGGPVEATVGHDPLHGQWAEYDGECSCSSYIADCHTSQLNDLWGQGTVRYAREAKASGEKEPILLPWDVETWADTVEDAKGEHHQVAWDAYYVAEFETQRQIKPEKTRMLDTAMRETVRLELGYKSMTTEHAFQLGWDACVTFFQQITADGMKVEMERSTHQGETEADAQIDRSTDDSVTMWVDVRALKRRALEQDGLTSAPAFNAGWNHANDAILDLNPPDVLPIGYYTPFKGVSTPPSYYSEFPEQDRTGPEYVKHEQKHDQMSEMSFVAEGGSGQVLTVEGNTGQWRTPTTQATPEFTFPEAREVGRKKWTEDMSLGCKMCTIAGEGYPIERERGQLEPIHRIGKRMLDQAIEDAVAQRVRVNPCVEIPANLPTYPAPQDGMSLNMGDQWQEVGGVPPKPRLKIEHDLRKEVENRDKTEKGKEALSLNTIFEQKYKVRSSDPVDAVGTRVLLAEIDAHLRKVTKENDVEWNAAISRLARLYAKMPAAVLRCVLSAEAEPPREIEAYDGARDGKFCRGRLEASSKIEPSPLGESPHNPGGMATRVPMFACDETQHTASRPGDAPPKAQDGLESSLMYKAIGDRLMETSPPVKVDLYGGSLGRYERDIMVKSHVIPKRGSIPTTIIESEEFLLPVMELTSCNEKIEAHEADQKRTGVVVFDAEVEPIEAMTEIEVRKATSEQLREERANHPLITILDTTVLDVAHEREMKRTWATIHYDVQQYVKEHLFWPSEELVVESELAVDDLVDCEWCSGSGEGGRWDADTRMMVVVENGCTKCAGAKKIPRGTLYN